LIDNGRTITLDELSRVISKDSLIVLLHFHYGVEAWFLPDARTREFDGVAYVGGRMIYPKPADQVLTTLCTQKSAKLESAGFALKR
jgi:hypothetical protein